MIPVKTYSIIIAIILPILLGCARHNDNSAKPNPNRSTILFDENWKFYLGNSEGAEKKDFDDSQWRVLDLPHDYSIEDIEGTNSPFDPEAIGQVNTGFTRGGTAWYRKSFNLRKGSESKKVHLQFDGIYMNAEVYLNGTKLGENPYGYTSFWFDISDEVKAGEENVIAVKVRNEGENSRWYSGSGIYRHVWLTLMDPIHIAHWGTTITTPEIDNGKATVKVQHEIMNETNDPKKIKVQTIILNSIGREVGKSEEEKTIYPISDTLYNLEITVSSPILWSVDQPHMYTAKTNVIYNNKLTDQAHTSFGIRSISFDPENGFMLNGEKMNLKGGCVHHDNGPLGAKAYDRAEERKVALLKASGFNAIRSSHNPPSPAFLSACDRLGMLVIDEAFDTWIFSKNPDDYSVYFENWWKKDIKSMIHRDRNHPSVIMWSIGNEIPGMDDPEIVEIAQQMAEYVRETDPTRPVTAGVNNLSPEKDPFFATLDIAGYNYAIAGDHGKEDVYEEDHNRKPDRIMYGSESYPLVAFDSWMAAKEKPYVLGDFIWTAFDYIGESSIGWLGYWQSPEFYPWTLAYCGDIDICGWKRPQSYYRDAFWGEKPVVHLFVKSPQPTFEGNPDRQDWSKWHFTDVWASWNWEGHEGEPLEIEVYSSFDKVELFLNDKSLGSKATNCQTKNMAHWKVPYQAGELKAIGYTDGQQAGVSLLKTAGKPSQLKLMADRTYIKADGQDLAYVTVEVLDGEGNIHPDAEDLIYFKVEGPGTIAGVGNANPMSVESYTASERKAWRGKCLVIIKAENEAGNIQLKASSGNFSAEILNIRSE